MGPKILITGGAGFIGTHLAELLRAEKQEVRSLDIRDPSDPVAGVEYLKGDVRDPLAVAEAAEGTLSIVHLAAVVGVPLCQQSPVESHEVNVNGTLRVLDYARKHGQRVVFSSSANVYGEGGKAGEGIEETTVVPPSLSFYAAQKRAGEDLMRLYHKHFGVEAVTLRLFNVYGPRQDPASPYSGVLSIFLSKIDRDESLELYGGGRQTRDFVSVSDAAEAIKRALSPECSFCSGEPINIGSGRAVTVRQLAEMLMKIRGKTVPLRDVPAREGDSLHLLANIYRAGAILGWAPRFSLEQGLRLLG